MIDKYWCWNRWCWYWRHFMIIISSIDWYYRYTWLWMWWWRWCLDLVIIQFTQIIGGWLWSLLVSMATKSISNILIIIMAGLCCRGCGCCWWCWRSGRRLTTTIAVAHTDDYDDEDDGDGGDEDDEWIISFMNWTFSLILPIETNNKTQTPWEKKCTLEHIHSHT